MLEKEDWQEPSCCFAPQAEAKAVAGIGGSDLSSDHDSAGSVGGSDSTSAIRTVIAEFDRLLAKDAKAEAAVYLEEKLLEFEKADDWASQLTILNEMMGFYRNSGEAEKGLESVEKGLRLVREHRMGDTVSGGTTFLNAATTMKAFQRTGEAMPYYEQAARAYGQNLDPYDYRFGGLFNNMALAYEDLGQYDKAEVYYKKAMDIMDRLKPGSILELAVTWVNLACLYEKWGQQEKTDGCLEKAIVLFHSTEVPHDAYYAFNCRKCAATFDHFGYFRMKKELSEEAERIYQEEAGRWSQ